MITQIYKGPINLILFIFSHPFSIIFLTIILITLIVGAFYPTVIYIYPYINPRSSYDSSNIFEKVQIKDITGKVIYPKWISPAGETISTYKLEFENDSAQDITINYRLDINNDFIEFEDIEMIPIRDKIIVPAKSSISRGYDFTILENSKTTDTIQFTLVANNNVIFVKNITEGRINYLSIRISYVIGAFLTILAFLIQFLYQKIFDKD